MNTNKPNSHNTEEDFRIYLEKNSSTSSIKDTSDSKRYDKTFLLSLNQEQNILPFDFEKVQLANLDLQQINEKELTSEQINTETCNLLKNLSIYAKKTINDFEKAQPSNSNQKIEFIEKLILNAFNSQEKYTQNALFQLLLNSLQAGVLDRASLKQGILSVVEQAEQKASEFLKLTSYTTDLLRIVLKEDFKDLNYSSLISELLHNASIQNEKNSLRDLTSSCSIKEILGKNDLPTKDDTPVRDEPVVNKNEAEKSLDSLENKEILEEKKTDIPDDKKILISYRKTFKTIFSNQKNDVGYIFDQIKTYFKLDDFKSKEFVATMALSLCKSCWNKENKTFNLDLFTNRSVILDKYLNQNEVFIFEALKAIKCLDEALNKPPGFLTTIFDSLYDIQIIDKNLFLKWKRNGKGDFHARSLLQLNSFFNSLEKIDEH